MPFLGNTPANTFVSIAKQTITGNGGTSYTLSYPVTNANEIDVFYNNVRQEPTVAYTASGTTITFTEAIQSTDSVYVIFNGQAVGTIDAPAGAYLPTTGGTVNGQLNVNNRIQIQQDAGSNNRLILRGTTGSSYRWSVDNFSSANQFRIFRENDSDGSAGMVAMQFDSSGRLLLPQQPAFFARSNESGGNVTTTGVMPFQIVVLNTGNCYSTSNNRFTAPIAGRYHVSTQVPPNTSPSVFSINKNGSFITKSQGGLLSNNSNTGVNLMACVIDLQANDYIDVRMESGSRYAWGSDVGYSYFSGYLVG